MRSQAFQTHWFHFGIFRPFWSLGSRTNVGHPQTWVRSRSLWSTLVLLSSSIGVSPVVLPGIWLYNQVACLMANGHDAKPWTPYSDQWSETCYMKVCVTWKIVWIACSAWGFWWWAPTPEKLWDWYFSVQSEWKTSAAMTSLSLWIYLILAQAKSQKHSSKWVLAVIVSPAQRETWFSIQIAPIAILLKMVPPWNDCYHLLVHNLLAINQEYWQQIDPWRQSHLLGTWPKLLLFL